MQQVQDLVQNPKEISQAFTTIKDLLAHTRRVYDRVVPFIDAIAINLVRPEQQDVIRRANIATFVSSILYARDVSFYNLNEYFLDNFVPPGHLLLNWQGAILLELKTQAYISVLMNSGTARERILDILFPQHLPSQILARHPDAPVLSPAEKDFIDRCKSRRSCLLAESSSCNAFGRLSKKYQWMDFVYKLVSSISENVDSIITSSTRDQLVTSRSSGDHDGYSQYDSIATLSVQTSHQSTPHDPVLSTRQMSHHPSELDRKKKSVFPASRGMTRHPWTKLEEDALLAGLSLVSGPYWAQILTLHGRGGSISEVLKNRNQVQLKDKARNLKIRYLKARKEVPECLKGVTGELTKRGGIRARASLTASEKASLA